MKFNTKVSTKTINHEGGAAFIQSPEHELYMFVCNSLMEDKFYESSTKQLKKLKLLIKKNKPEFCINLMLYAREQMYLRSITHVLAVEIAQAHKGVAKEAIARVCQRADDMVEILAYQISQYGRTIPQQIKKGLSKAFSKFDEYKLAKYDRGGAVKLRDVIFLTHPKRTELTDRVINGKLQVPITWETEVSKNGGTKETWAKLINENHLGYMALLRNLRNILKVCDKEEIMKVATRIADKNEVEKSKQLPFRFWSAYKMLQDNNNAYTSVILEALDTACGYSAKNLKLSGVSMIASDVSGSMQKSISKNSKIEMIEIGLLMQGIAKQISEHSFTGIFGDSFKVKNYPKGSCFSPLLNYKEGEVGYSTNGYLVIKYLVDNNISVDNILIFSDCEMYGGQINTELHRYRAINPNVKVFVFNLAGYSTIQFPENSVYQIGGWSDKVFDYIEAINSKSVLDKIRNYS